MSKIRHHPIALRCLFRSFFTHLPIGTSDKKSAPGTTFHKIVTSVMDMHLHFWQFLHIFDQSRGMQVAKETNRASCYLPFSCHQEEYVTRQWCIQLNEHVMDLYNCNLIVHAALAIRASEGHRSSPSS